MIYDDLTSAVFEAIMLEDDWDRALQVMSDATGGAAFLIASGDPEVFESFESHTVNFDDGVFARGDFSEASQFDPEVNSAIPRVYAAPVGKTFDRRSFLPDREFEKDPFYGDVMIAQDLYFTRIVKLVEAPGLIAGGYMAVSRKRGPIEGPLLEQFESWLPTLKVILQMKQKLREQAGVASGLAAAVDRLDRGVVVVDRTLKILRMNPEAERIFDKADAVSALSGKLQVRPMECQRRLAAAVRAVAGWTREAPSDALTLHLPNADGLTAYEVSVLPAEGVASRLAAASGVATVVIADLFRLEDLPSIETLRARHGLTQMQARVAQLSLLPFSSKRDLANRLGLEESTVRSHLAAAREIVGGRNLHEFVQLVAGRRWRPPGD